MLAKRFSENPLVTSKDVKPTFDGWEVISAFNAGVIEYNGEILLLMRVAERPVGSTKDKVYVPVLDTEKGGANVKILTFTCEDDDVCLEDPRVITFPDKIYLTSISHFRIARSKDGRNFTVDEKPAMFPDQSHESYGIEDPRITKIGDTYYIVYKGVAQEGITQCIASTKDFIDIKKHGIILCPENMDGMLFPEKIRDKYVLLHRPMPKYIGSPNMWIAYSEDLLHWGEHKFMIGCSHGTWEGGRIGGGAVPFLTDKGWIEIYHAGDTQDRYCLGAILLDKDYPEKVLAKTNVPIISPEADYEVYGFKDNVIFTCGALVKGDTVTVYYGAADEMMAAADFSLKEIFDSMEKV